MKCCLIKILILSVLIAGCASTKPSNESCSELKNGFFILNLYNHSTMGHWKKIAVTLIRNDSLEYAVSSMFPNDTTISTLRWESNCEYYAVMANPKTALDSGYIRFHLNGVRHRIIKTTKDYYIELRSGRQTDTLWKVNEIKPAMLNR